MGLLPLADPLEVGQVPHQRRQRPVGRPQPPRHAAELRVQAVDDQAVHRHVRLLQAGGEVEGLLHGVPPG